MSSGSDDLDEDELLQMALKEQAQRDLNYQKPPSSSSSSTTNSRKPVVNFVQQPKIPQKPAARSTAPSPLQPKARKMSSIDYDDDSDLEMLSISSGDDESSKDRGSINGRPKGRVKDGAQDEDRVWDGEEPDSWKKVDESEVIFFFYLLFIYFYVCIGVCIHFVWTGD